MALTVKELIEKLEQLENKSVAVYFETPDSLLSVDRVILDENYEIGLVNDVASEHCDCEYCKEFETEL
nr:MAG TPA: Protein of unknown function (DUF2847) [Caudoviricetes sp.]